MTRLDEIWIYPFKSLPGVKVSSAMVRQSGALANDRRWAFVDEQQRFWNSKRTPLLHQFQFRFDPEQLRFQFTDGKGEQVEWAALESKILLENWFSHRLQGQVRLVENAEVGHPDDLENSGPTVISWGTLAAIADWFPGIPIEEVRARFRANLIFASAEPFMEDRLLPTEQDPTPTFQIGDVVWMGTNPCQRCIVPSRHPATGAVLPGFAKEFAQHRAANLPKWSPRSLFNHFYRASTNTRLVSGGGQTIHVGQNVNLTTAESQ